jgi:hypothetical protein
MDEIIDGVIDAMISELDHLETVLRDELAIENHNEVSWLAGRLFGMRRFARLLIIGLEQRGQLSEQAKVLNLLISGL